MNGREKRPNFHYPALTGYIPSGQVTRNMRYSQWVGEIAMSEQSIKIEILRAEEDSAGNISELEFHVFAPDLDARVIVKPTNRQPANDRIGALMNNFLLLSTALISAARTPELVDWSHYR
jgi:hypothetical protein